MSRLPWTQAGQAWSDWSWSRGGRLPFWAQAPNCLLPPACEAAAAETNDHTFSGSRPHKFISSQFRGQRPSTPGWCLCSERHKAEIKALAGLRSLPGGSREGPPTGRSARWLSPGPRDCRTEVPVSSRLSAPRSLEHSLTRPFEPATTAPIPHLPLLELNLSDFRWDCFSAFRGELDWTHLNPPE